jgi:ABC-type sulfate transport system permease subunit
MLTDDLALVPLQNGGGGGGIAGVVFLLLFLVLFLVPAAGMWKTFTKAGKPGWGAFIPILNVLYLLGIADKETWWVVLFVIPGINVLIGIVVTIDVAKNFDKGAGYGLGLAFLPFIFWPLLGFGDANYVGDMSRGV